jgi:chorismate dehydratase
MDLGIARCGAVGSVLLFSCRPVEDLDGARVALTRESRTSRALLRILLADAFGRRVRYVEAGEPADARLAIGDEAIALRAAGRWPFVVDLGAAWHRFTGLPFVYARWVVRRDLAPGAARALAVGLSHSLAVCASRADVPRRKGMTPLAARAYLDSFQYRLGPAEQAGLRRFHGELLRHDLLRRPRERLAIGSAA